MLGDGVLGDAGRKMTGLVIEEVVMAVPKTMKETTTTTADKPKYKDNPRRT